MNWAQVQKQREEILHYRSLFFKDSIQFENIPENIQNAIRLFVDEDQKWMAQMRQELKAKKMKLKDLPPKFWFFIHIDLSDCGLTTLEGMPSDLKHVQHLNLKSNNLQSLKGLPSHLPNLTDIFLSNNPLLSLKGLPDTLPSLIWFHANDLPHLSTLEGFPLSAPKLREISFRNTPLISFKGLPSSLPSLQEISLGTSLDPTRTKTLPVDSLCTLSYVSLFLFPTMIQFMHDSGNQLTSTGKHLLIRAKKAFEFDGKQAAQEDRRVLHQLNRYFSDPRNLARPKDEPDPGAEALQILYARDPTEKQQSLAAIEIAVKNIWNYYATTPEELAVQYCEDPTSLSEENYRRLVHEADYADWKLLANNLSHSDPIFANVKNNHPVRLNDDFSIL
ncbi:hypothetical protein [Candidatus Lokiarchaeum ossiferum]|uniref:hypothetical protein n=1 Tax=Candidatus Lokiarchaeum ossiferum TaxID=2951803 RepID=UPI00352F600B